MKTFSDEEIKKVIVDHLSWNTKVDDSKVVVSVESDGLVTLTGTVNSHAEKQEAAESARHVSGVRSVINRLIVLHPAGKKEVSDEEIEKALKHAFLWDPHIDEDAIEIQIKNGVVTLRGCVTHYSQRFKAETIASQMSGIREILNELSITCTEPVEDENISQAIMDEIRNTDPDAVRNIEILVNNGFVEISGSVHSYPEEKRVFDVVAHTKGVTGIKNNLSVIVSPVNRITTSNPRK
jgi:osmotically-inducible protein OsmY